MLGLCAIALALSAASPARAQVESDEAARAHFQAGAAYFDTGEYEDALREFQRAYALSRRPELFYNFSLVYERTGDLAQAVEYLRRYLTEVESVDNRGALEIRLGNFERRLGEQEQQRAQREQQQEQQEQQQEQQPPPRAVDGGGGVPILAWVGWGVGAAGLAAFGIFGALALSEDSSLSETCADGRCTEDQVASLETYALLADVGWITAISGGAAGLLFLLASGSGGGEEPGEAAQLAPWIGPGAAGVALGGAL